MGMTDLKNKFAAKFEHHCLNLLLVYNKYLLLANIVDSNVVFVITKKFKSEFVECHFSFQSLNLEKFMSARGIRGGAYLKGSCGLTGKKEVAITISLKSSNFQRKPQLKLDK